MHSTHLKGCPGSFSLIINKPLHHIDSSHPDVQPSFGKDQLLSRRASVLQDSHMHIEET